MGATLFVGNLAWDTTSDSLSAMLSRHGTIVSCDTGTVRNGRTRGWAIVQMGSPQDAQNVIANCDNADLDGRNLNVRLDQKQDEGARAPRGGGGAKASVPAVVATLASRARQRTPLVSRWWSGTFLGVSPTRCSVKHSSRSVP